MKELDYIKMGKRIRQLRKLKGWSQDDLAKRCGISMSFLGHIERGTRIMSLETLVSICGMLDVGADELLWGVINSSDAVCRIWNPEDKNFRQADRPNADSSNSSGSSDRSDSSDRFDSYSMYVRIMKSVAEIMNET